MRPQHALHRPTREAHQIIASRAVLLYRSALPPRATNAERVNYRSLALNYRSLALNSVTSTQLGH